MKDTKGNVEFGFSVEPKGKSLKLVNQVHGNIIKPYSKGSIPDADGVFTKALDTPIHIFTADCIPLLYFAKEAESPVLAVHCGWRGANLKIAEKACEYLKKPTVVIGPSILKCCFEVKEDLVQAFEKEGHSLNRFLSKKGERLFFDLPEFVVQTQLKDAEVIREWNRCTYCSEPLLPSYRRNKGTDPQIRAWIVRKSLPSD